MSFPKGPEWIIAALALVGTTFVVTVWALIVWSILRGLVR